MTQLDGQVGRVDNPRHRCGYCRSQPEDVGRVDNHLRIEVSCMIDDDDA
jgi:hypothetical protein